ncbi:MAG: ComF family protein [candidate division KSB1 bacterium]|nr:ComF family protein [candidate division KSB1 bacterium]
MVIRNPLSLKTFLSTFRSLIAVGLDFVYPSYCLACGAKLQHSELLLCEPCWQQLPQLPGELDMNVMARSIEGPIYFSKAISVWEFTPTVQQVVHHLKYQNFRRLAPIMGSFMAARLSCFSLPQDTMLIPIPLHRTRLRERGYNQSALLCQAIAKHTGFNYSDKIVRRIRYTHTQTALNAAERRRNVAEAFRVVAPSVLIDKLVILVDDVITTGATMNACAKELVTIGASDVYLLSAVKA